MRSDAFDRRRAPRRVPDADESLCRVRLRTGRELAVLEISDRGALVEGATRLLPGTHLDVHVMTRNGRVLVRSRVVSARVSAIAADVVTYRVALGFEIVVDTSAAGYGFPGRPRPAPAQEGIAYPDASPRAPDSIDDGRETSRVA